jgi:hypothetical protein
MHTSSGAINFFSFDFEKFGENILDRPARENKDGDIEVQTLRGDWVKIFRRDAKEKSDYK